MLSKDLRVVRVLLEPDQLDVDRVEALAGLGEEFPQQIVHKRTPSEIRTSVCCKNSAAVFTAALISRSVQIRIW